jgi:hypothetical protein
VRAASVQSNFHGTDLRRKLCRSPHYQTFQVNFYLMHIFSLENFQMNSDYGEINGYLPGRSNSVSGTELRLNFGPIE